MRIIRKNLKVVLFLFAMLSITLGYAQVKTVTGNVSDAGSGEPLPGVTIVVKGTTQGTITDFDGNYSIDVEQGQTIVLSYIGYNPQEIVISASNQVNVQLEQSMENLDEVVVIGYGQVKKEDATGSVAAVSSDDFNQGAITSPQELVTGKIAGVQITNSGGAPGEGSTIRIRGGSSLSASNDPLIVIDGVPISSEGVSGMRNPLNMIHPSDIETMTVLKDASATAIYGSRASNGVILITTKKGRKGAGLKLSYNGFSSYSTPSGKVDFLSTDDFRQTIIDQNGADSNAASLLGSSDTDWQDVVFDPAVSHDHNFSVTGNIKDIPFRASIGYSDQNGILKKSSMERWTGTVGFNPSLFDDHLKMNLNFKGMKINNNFSNQGAIGTAVSFDPTQPVYVGSDRYGGFYTWLQPNGNPNTLAPTNPLAMIMMHEDTSDATRAVANAQFDYNFHFLPDLKATLNLGYEYTDSEGTTIDDDDAPWTIGNGGGYYGEYTQEKKNKLLDFYLTYDKELASIESNISVMGGYSWQHFWSENYNFARSGITNEIINPENWDPTEYYLVSFFGRLNYSFKNRYLLTLTVRQDGTSRFSPDTRWGLFPSAAFAWRIKEEEFLKNNTVVSDLKLRLGYGITGQQNIGSGDYPYLARYTYSQENARYQFGDTYYTTIRPEGYDSEIKWEETTTYNIGLDYGFMDDRITGTVDVYKRVTDDLLNFIPVPAGTNLTNMLLTNVGDLENRGIEFSILGRIISKQDLSWEVGFNATYNENEITKLTATQMSLEDYPGVETGGISGAVGNNIQIHSVGYPANSFYVYEQVYDEAGKPIQGLYVDRNEDGQITSEDKYRYEKSAPDWFLGFNSKLYWKNWDFGFAGRVSLGNYVYNNVWSSSGSLNNLYWSSNYLLNVNQNALTTGFENPEYFSDYYVKNASFLRLDNISLGHTFKNLNADKMSLRLYGTVQNVFVVSDYEGLDPEVSNGIDNNIYPRPRVFMMGLSIDY
ncbi:TonB-dependent receptor [uncultured Draconibacterium sp.]|uniref:SusC/RagA family TonB-linked outer membrane protein n=1 Tax=uncultured Draconibacterium sp. TaxID=1573823 RepID=UPI0029C6E7F5|nr:TonB-dependent receptor [uncultured Draconibacterium sp.]